jgi:hypothetical protein
VIWPNKSFHRIANAPGELCITPECKKDMGIRNLTIDQIRQRIESFDYSYVQDWSTWVTVRRDYPFDHTPPEFGRILRRWQACRPNAMRRCRADATHEAPYLEDLLNDALSAAAALDGFDLSQANPMNEVVENALQELWAIFRNLSYSGRCRNGLAGVVGISKAVLLITEGRVGPAFDSTKVGTRKWGRWFKYNFALQKKRS